jgi:hypothetical protein
MAQRRTAPICSYIANDEAGGLRDMGEHEPVKALLFGNPTIGEENAASS